MVYLIHIRMWLHVLFTCEYLLITLQSTNYHPLVYMHSTLEYYYYMYINLKVHAHIIVDCFLTVPTETPQNVTVDTDKRSVTLEWSIPPPSGRNGIITSYMIQWKSGITQTSPINHTVEQPTFTTPEHISRTLGGLTPYTNYIWRVAAVNINGTGPFSEWNNFRTDEDG